jgi:RimJ/RimL family protein N-acetyltransferase
MPGQLKSGCLVQLRPFTRSDYPTLISWIPTVNALLLFSGANAPWPLTEHDLAERASHPDILAWTAVLADNPQTDLGHLEIVRTAPTKGRFARVMIEPGSRGKGLARGLIHAGLDSARMLGLDRVDLNVIPGNEPAIRTYRGVGFRMLDVDPEFPSMLRMTLSLSEGATNDGNDVSCDE